MKKRNVILPILLLSGLLFVGCSSGDKPSSTTPSTSVNVHTSQCTEIPETSSSETSNESLDTSSEELSPSEDITTSESTSEEISSESTSETPGPTTSEEVTPTPSTGDEYTQEDGDGWGEIF